MRHSLTAVPNRGVLVGMRAQPVAGHKRMCIRFVPSEVDVAIPGTKAGSYELLMEGETTINPAGGNVGVRGRVVPGVRSERGPYLSGGHGQYTFPVRGWPPEIRFRKLSIRGIGSRLARGVEHQNASVRSCDHSRCAIGRSTGNHAPQLHEQRETLSPPDFCAAGGTCARAGDRGRRRRRAGESIAGRSPDAGATIRAAK
jgi:hypothetical protein